MAARESEIERPEGEKGMGEQQEGLGVDEFGKSRAGQAGDPVPGARKDDAADIALEERDVFFLCVSRMHMIGCLCCALLYGMQRAGVPAIDGWWIVCTPFVPALCISRWQYVRACRSKPHVKSD